MAPNRQGPRTDVVEDGEGNYWIPCQALDCDLRVIKPGVAQCHGRCDYPEEQGWMIEDGY